VLDLISLLGTNQKSFDLALVDLILQSHFPSKVGRLTPEATATVQKQHTQLRGNLDAKTTWKKKKAWFPFLKNRQWKSNEPDLTLSPAASSLNICERILQQASPDGLLEKNNGTGN